MSHAHARLRLVRPGFEHIAQGASRDWRRAGNAAVQTTVGPGDPVLVGAVVGVGFWWAVQGVRDVFVCGQAPVQAGFKGQNHEVLTWQHVRSCYWSSVVVTACHLTPFGMPS